MKHAPNIFCFTARRRDPHEVKLAISAEAEAQFNALPRGKSRLFVNVTDLNTGERWRIRRAACGAGCYCAAHATPL
jgi:hypothetical protein